MAIPKILRTENNLRISTNPRTAGRSRLEFLLMTSCSKPKRKTFCYQVKLPIMITKNYKNYNSERQTYDKR